MRPNPLNNNHFTGNVPNANIPLSQQNQIPLSQQNTHQVAVQVIVKEERPDPLNPLAQRVRQHDVLLTKSKVSGVQSFPTRAPDSPYLSRRQDPLNTPRYK